MAKEGFELLTRVLCDAHPAHGTDAAYLFAQTEDNQPSVFEPARRLVEEDAVSGVCILQAVARSGYPGFDVWHEALVRQGIPGDRIEGVEVEAGPMLNTRIEAEAVVRFARRKGYRSLLVVAAPFHQLRAFMTVVTVAVQAYPELRLYSRPGVVLPWHEQVAHSQGTQQTTRRNLIRSELEKVAAYQRKGDLGSYELVLDYLNGRDEAA